MGLIWAVFGILVVVAGVRYRQRLNSQRSDGAPSVDDAAIERIIREGKLPSSEDEEALDRKAAAEAEEQFWDEYWDEPDE